MSAYHPLCGGPARASGTDGPAGTPERPPADRAPCPASPRPGGAGWAAPGLLSGQAAVTSPPGVGAARPARREQREVGRDALAETAGRGAQAGLEWRGAVRWTMRLHGFKTAASEMLLVLVAVSLNDLSFMCLARGDRERFLTFLSKKYVRTNQWSHVPSPVLPQVFNDGVRDLAALESAEISSRYPKRFLPIL